MTTAPSWVYGVLAWPGLWILTRVGLSSAYLVGGVTKLVDFHGAMAEQAHFGLQPAWIWAGLAVIVEIVGSLALILGRWIWLAAGALSALTIIATLVADPFWSLQGHDRFVALNTFLEHIGLIAGLAMAAVIAADKTPASATVGRE